MKSLYLFALLPPEDLRIQIDEIRLSCSEKFGVMKALRPPVHITLYRPFRIEEDYENNIIGMIQTVASGLQPFRQDLENFEAFDTHAIVIRALDNPGILQLNSRISSVFLKQGIDIQPAENHPFRPHLTIAYRDIKPEVFPVIWDEYKDMKFKRSFIVDHFSLLKHDGKQWNLIKNFPFRPVRV